LELRAHRLQLAALNLLGLTARRLPQQPCGVANAHRHTIGIIARRQVGSVAIQALAERGKPALEHRADGIGRAAADLLAHALDRRARALVKQHIGGRCLMSR
jgi:hypothetical protein